MNGLSVCKNCDYIVESIEEKVYRIPKRSAKRKTQEQIYKEKRKEFLKKNPRCAVFPRYPSTEIHHKKGRIGDLLTDERYFLAVSVKGHQIIEKYPEWAKEQGFSLNRLEHE